MLCGTEDVDSSAENAVAQCVGPGSVRSVSHPEAFCADMSRLLEAPLGL